MPKEHSVIVSSETVNGTVTSDVQKALPGEKVYLLSLRATIEEDEEGRTTMRWVNSPAEIEGTAENESTHVVYLRIPTE